MATWVFGTRGCPCLQVLPELPEVGSYNWICERRMLGMHGPRGHSIQCTQTTPQPSLEFVGQIEPRFGGIM